MSKKSFVFVKKYRLTARFVIVFTAMFLAFSSLLPVFVGNAKATTGQLSLRSLALSSGISAKTNVSYTFTFTIVSTTAIKGLKFVACDNAFGTYGGGNTCTTGSAANSLSFSSAAFGTQSGFADNSTNFAVDNTSNTFCTPAANVLCADRTIGSPTGETTLTSKTIKFTGITNPTIPTGNGYTFYIGIYTYSATSSNTPLDGGTVASAVVQTLEVDARVAETLAFCVGTTGVDNATSSVAGDCSAVSGSAVNIGTLDSSAVNVSPLNTNGGNNLNGVAMVRSNAANGTTVGYDAIQAGSGSNHLGTLRISGANCTGPGNSNSDGCINAAGTSQHTFTAGTEEFGMTIAGTNCGSTSISSYSCTYPTSNNLVPQTNYLGETGSYCATDTCNTGGNGFAWDETGTSVTTIASSAGSTIKQIDDEALILKFAATSNIITPFGSYSVQVDFVASPTY